MVVGGDPRLGANPCLWLARLQPAGDAMTSIGIVDDNPAVLRQMRLLMERAGFSDVRAYSDPHQALEAFSRVPPGVLLVDYRMPGLDGLELLARLQRSGAMRHTPVAVVSGAPDLDGVRMAAFRAGAHQVLAKSTNWHEFALRVQNFARLAAVTGVPQRPESLFEPLQVPRCDSTGRQGPRQAPGGPSIDLLVTLAGFRGGVRRGHDQRVADFAVAIGRAHGLSVGQQDDLLQAAALHDIGEIAGPSDHLGLARTLPREDRAQMELHTMRGHSLLRDETAPALKLAAEIALSHHEHWNGAGYPLGLAGAAIPLSGRIVAVADALEAMTSDRPHRPAMSFEAAEGIVLAASGTQFDPEVARAFQSARLHCRLIHERTGRHAGTPASAGVFCDWNA